MRTVISAPLTAYQFQLLVSFNLLQVWKLNGKTKEKEDECDTRCK